MAMAKALALSVTRSLVAFQAKPPRRLKTCSVLIGCWLAPGAIASTHDIAPAVPEHSFSQLQPYTQQIVQSGHHNPPAVTSFVLFESGVSPGWGDRQDIFHLGVSPSGRYITALTSTSKRAGDRPVEVRSTQIWDIENNQEVSRLFQSEQFIPQYLSPNGRYLFTTEEDQETIQIWDVEEDREVFSLQDRFCEVAGFSADSQYFISLRLLEETDNEEVNREIRIWDFIDNRQVANIVLSESQSVNCGRHSTGKVHVSPNSQYIALEIDDYSSDQSHAGVASATAVIWDLDNNQEVVRIKQDLDHSFENRFAYVSFSPNSQYVATAAEDGTVQVWDLNLGEEIVRIVQPQGSWGGETITVNFSSDSRHLLSKNTSSVSVWDIEAKQELIGTPVEANVIYLNGLFSEDYQDLIVHGIRGVNQYDESKSFVSTWNIETGQRIAHVESPRIGGSLQFSSDGRYISSVTGRLSAAILDAVTLESLFTLQIDSVSVDDGFLDFFYSFDSQYLLTTKSICNLDPCLDYGVADHSTVVQLWELP